MRKISISLFLVFVSFQCFSQGVNWLSLEEAFELQKKNPKPMLVDVYTDWCGWCKHMDATTFKDPQIVTYLNQNFYAVKYNAETKDSMTINSKLYVNPNPANSRSTHQFALELGVNSYPTVVFYDKTGQTPTIASGALKADEIAPILVFFKEDLSTMIDVNTFTTDFNKTFKLDAVALANQTKMKWYTYEQGLAKAKKENKKLWIQTYTDDCITCKVMDSTVYKNSFIVDYLSKNYIPIKFNAYSRDTITIQGKKLNPTNDGPFPYHQLIYATLQNQGIKTPALLIFDENEQMLAPVPSYLNIRYCEALAVYFKEGKDKQNIDFNAFVQGYTFQSILKP